MRDQQVPEPLRSAAGRDEYERPALLAEVADGHVPARHPNDLDRLFVDDVDGLIAGRRLHVDGRDLEVDLDEARIARLLAGFDVETHVHANGDAWPILLVAGPSAPADAPGTRRVTIGNLPRFLADPTVVGDGGGRFPLRFDRDDVMQLRRDGVATVGDGDHAVTVMYGPASGGAGIEASTDRDGEALEAMSPFGTVPSAADRFALGIYLAWRQTWRLKGYSRSGLLHSLTLAPQEETTIEVFSWDRRRTSLEQSSSFESDESIENSDTNKDVIDVVREMSSSNEFQIQGHAQLNVKYAAVEAEVGVQAGGTNKLNETTRRSTNHLEETTQKAAMRVRVSRQTKISEAAEFGREERVTRKVRNGNLCRTLTLDYFEVLAHYDVRTAFANEDAQICLFVPFPFWLQGKVFTPDDLRTHERALRMALIDRALAPAFDGARLLAARDWAMTHVCDKPRCNSSRLEQRRRRRSRAGNRSPPPAGKGRRAGRHGGANAALRLDRAVRAADHSHADRAERGRRVGRPALCVP